jgi:hypothetical protein
MGRLKPRNRQRTFLSNRMKLVIGASVFLFASVSIFIVIKLTDVEDSEAFVEGDYRSIDSGYWDDDDIWERYDGSDWTQSSSGPYKEGAAIIIDSGHVVVLEEEVRLSKLIVLPGAEVRLMTNTIRIDKTRGEGFMKVEGIADLSDCIIEGNADFILGAGGTLRLGSPYGISKTRKSGNLQLKGKYEIDKNIHVIYDGTLVQETGNGLPPSVQKLTIDNIEGVNLSGDLSITGSLNLESGTLFTGNNALIVGERPEDGAELIYNKGSVCGELHIMTDLSESRDLHLPLSDGSASMEVMINVSADKFDDGYLITKFYAGSVISDDRSPFEASEMVIAITGRGFFTSKPTQGLKDAVYVSRGYKVNKNGHPVSNWSLMDYRTYNKQEHDNSGTAKTIYNVVYGPNPIDSVFYLKFDSEVTGSVMISLVDAGGKQVVNETLEVTSGSNAWKYNCDPDLSPGNYFLRVSTTSEIHSFLVTKGNLPG